MANEVNDVLRINARMRYNGASDIINAYEVLIASGTPGDDANVFDACNTIVNAAYVHLNGSIPAEITYADITVYNKTKETLVGSGAWDTLTAGAGAADAMPPQIANLVVFPTASLRHQGRKYLPPFTEGLYDNGLISSGGLSLLDLYGDQIMAGVSGFGFVGEFGVQGVNDFIWRPFVSFKIIPAARTQRRRTVGFGS